ncbi:4042_t:CDS:1, partial [Racocetra persica]
SSRSKKLHRRYIDLGNYRFNVFNYFTVMLNEFENIKIEDISESNDEFENIKIEDISE